MADFVNTGVDRGIQDRPGRWLTGAHQHAAFRRLRGRSCCTNPGGLWSPAGRRSRVQRVQGPRWPRALPSRREAQGARLALGLWERNPSPRLGLLAASAERRQGVCCGGRCGPGGPVAAGPVLAVGFGPPCDRQRGPAHRGRQPPLPGVDRVVPAGVPGRHETGWPRSSGAVRRGPIKAVPVSRLARGGTRRGGVP